MNKILIGGKYGRLTILSIVPEYFKNGQGRKHFVCNCICECGNKIKTEKWHISSGHSLSCGCFSKEILTKRNTTHGMSGSQEFSSWSCMLTRCNNKKHKFYKNYGGRGIVVCERWKSFDNFIKDMGLKPKGYDLDRINNALGYFKENCRWVSRKRNCNNKSNNHILEYCGIKKSISEWATIKGLKVATLWQRVRKGWLIKDALNSKIGSRSNRVVIDG
jgi:hypothetical protein